MSDPVNHPPHYTKHPSGIECIQVTEHMNFCIGNAVKYLWRAGLKGDAITDLEKAVWYIKREIARRSPAGNGTKPPPTPHVFIKELEHALPHLTEMLAAPTAYETEGF